MFIGVSQEQPKTHSGTGSDRFPRGGSRNPTITVVALNFMPAEKLNNQTNAKAVNV